MEDSYKFGEKETPLSFILVKINQKAKKHMSYFAYACKTEGKNGISRLISEMA